MRINNNISGRGGMHTIILMWLASAMVVGDGNGCGGV